MPAQAAEDSAEEDSAEEDSAAARAEERAAEAAAERREATEVAVSEAVWGGQAVSVDSSVAPEAPAVSVV